MKERRLKCRYCGLQIPVWFTTRNGNRHSGMDRLVEHVLDTHTPTQILRERLAEIDALNKPLTRKE